MNSIMTYFKRHKFQLSGLGFIAFLGLTPLLWFSPGYLIDGTDINFPLRIQDFIGRTYVWNSVFLGGTDRSMDMPLLSYTGIGAFLYSLGQSPIVAEKLTFVIFFTAAGFSVYFLISQLTRFNHGKAALACLITAVFYMFNFYQLYAWQGIKVGELSGLILIPALLGVFISGLERRISYLKTAVITCMVSVLSAGVGVQPPVLGIFLLSLLLYLIFHLLWSRAWRDREQFLQILRFSVFFLSIFLLVNLFWILPAANFIIQSGYYQTQRGLDVYRASELLDWTSKYSSFLNIFRMFGDITWFDGWGGEQYYPFFQAYRTNPLLIVFSFVWPVLAFSALLVSRHRYVVIIATFTILCTFLSKGIHGPIGNIYLWLFENFPAFWIYRAPWQKFGVLMALGYSFLAGITCIEIYRYLQKRISIIRLRIKKADPILQRIPGLFIVLIVLSTVLYAYPLVSGKMLPSSEGDVGYHAKFDLGFHQTYPQYIFQSASWINSINEQFKIVTLPDDKVAVYDWGYGAPSDITLRLFDKGVIFRQYGQGTAPPASIESIHQLFLQSLYDSSSPNLARIAGLLNIRYILQRNDFRYDFYGDTDSPEFIQSRLAFQRGISFEKSFGRWDFYKIDDDSFLPHIYAASNTIQINGDVDEMFRVVLSDKFEPDKSVFVLASQATDQNKITLDSMGDTRVQGNAAIDIISPNNILEPKISFSKVNPTKYEVKVSNVTQPFILVFSEAYQSQWTAYINGEDNKTNWIEAWFQKPIYNDKHLLVNGYANGWYVDPQETGAGEQFSITLYYKPQSLFYLGVIFSGSTLICCLASLLYVFWRKRSDNHVVKRTN